jgi:hypothetical protein
MMKWENCPGINTMIERLGKRDMAITKARDELELRVKERTAELTLANERLVLEIEERKRAAWKRQPNDEAVYDVLETCRTFLLDSDYQCRLQTGHFRKLLGNRWGSHAMISFNLTEPCEIWRRYGHEDAGAASLGIDRSNGRDYDIYYFPFTDTPAPC